MASRSPAGGGTWQLKELSEAPEQGGGWRAGSAGNTRLPPPHPRQPALTLTHLVVFFFFHFFILFLLLFLSHFHKQILVMKLQSLCDTK